ncbi:hypothetical protein ACRRTK_005186 [Alexandromys fortis]
MCSLMEGTDASHGHRRNTQELCCHKAEKGGERRPSEYLFDWGTNGTSIYMYRVLIIRPVTSAAST